ncbi:hypothetical protein LEMLEM_LOCUS20843 [Lemmus lemmus]
MCVQSWCCLILGPCPSGRPVWASSRHNFHGPRAQPHHHSPRRPPASGCRKLRVSHQLQASRRVLTPSSKRKEHQAECGSTGQQFQPLEELQRLAANQGYTVRPYLQKRRRTERGEGERRGEEEEEAEDDDYLDSVRQRRQISRTNIKA